MGPFPGRGPMVQCRAAHNYSASSLRAWQACGPRPRDPRMWQPQPQPCAVARAHARSWPGACAAVAAALAMAARRVALVTWRCGSTASSTRGGDAAVVPTNGAEGDEGSWWTARSGSVDGDMGASATCVWRRKE
jgi:hypothetical protein